MPIDVNTLSPVGKTCLQRALLEAERRFAGNKTEQLTGAFPLVTEREYVSILLDPRTNRLLTDRDTMKKAFALFVTALVNFTLKAKKHIAQAEQKKAAAAAAAARARISEQRGPSSPGSPKESATPVLAHGAAAWDFLPSPPKADTSSEQAAEVDVDAFWESKREEIEVDARACCTRWLKRSFDWYRLFPAELADVVKEVQPHELDPIKHLLKLPIGKLFKEVIAEPSSFASYGYIPLMAGSSPYE